MSMPMTVLIYAAVALAAYFLGCCNTALIISKYILKDDIRNHGSGNAGLTNFYRVFGKKMVLWVILGDLAKAVLSCVLGGLLIGGVVYGAAWGSGSAQVALGKLWGGIFVMLGHSFPCMFGFKGGKGVLCGAGIILCMDWRIALLCLGVFAILVAITRWVSLGSMVASALFPIACGVLYRSVSVVLLAIVAAFLIVFRHRENAKRIAKGEENRLEFH